MRLFLLLSMSFLFSCVQTNIVNEAKDDDENTSPGFDVDVHFIYENLEPTPGKQFLAVLGQDIFTAESSILVFGKKSGKLKVRSFPINYYFSTSVGSKESGRDDFYTLRTTVLLGDKLHVSMKGDTGGYEYDMTYRRLSVGDKNDLGQKAADIFYAGYDRLIKNGDPKNLKELLSILSLHLRSHEYSPNEDEVALKWSFQIDYDQIESYYDRRKPSSVLAKANIRIDAKDPISKAFNSLGKWTAEKDLPEPDSVPYDEEVDEYPIFFTYYKSIGQGQGLEPGVIKNGFKKFSRYTIIERQVWECEDTYSWESSFTWLLSDGSSFTYSQGMECD